MEKGNFEKVAVKVSMVSVVVNTILSLLNLIAGLIANSGAMVSDAVHSASDVFSSIVVMIGVKISARESDENHPYGHERMECVAAIILATLLAATGIGIGYKAVVQLVNHDTGVRVPGMLALIAAIVSIVIKEAMYWYTRYYALQINSGALMADAWHHRSDAFSSVGALIGIAGARMGFLMLEPLASVVICLFIEKAAMEIFIDAIDKMVDKACNATTERELVDCALGIPGVISVDLVRTRLFANKIYVEMELGADGNLSLKEGHDIAEKVHDAIEEAWPEIKHITIHMNPVEVEKE